MDEEHHHMDQILPGLWIGDLHSAKDVNTLRANNIHSILTAMRGRFSIPEVCPNFLHMLIYTLMLGRS
jgi:dual specificity phosphatase 12